MAYQSSITNTDNTDRCLGASDSILVPGVDRNERNAGVCVGSPGHICSIYKWMVL